MTKKKKLLPIAPLERMMKNYGVERISEDVYDEVEGYINSKVGELTKEAINSMKRDGRKTLMKKDIEWAKRYLKS